MRTSNRWLGASLLAVILVMTGASLLLYRQLRLGYILSFQQERAAGLVHHSLPPVHYLVLDGTIWVNIIPADSNVIQIPAEQSGPDHQAPVMIARKISDGQDRGSIFRLGGDTLFVYGGNTQPLIRPYTDWYYRMSVQQINVYASSLEHIQVFNGQIVLRGRSHPVPGTSVTLVARHSTVWLAEMDDRPEGGIRHKVLPNEFFDTVSLRLSSSVLLLNKPAVIAGLQARLDSASELNDRNATLGRGRISTGADSRVSFTGNNFSQTTITTE